MDYSNNKHAKRDERVSHDAFQNNYDELVDNSTPSDTPFYVVFLDFGEPGNKHKTFE